jgi:SOS-response transcriptional repressor LexA
METWLKCEIAPGQFTGEYAAIGLLVEVWQQGELIVVRLPRQTLENGQFVTVRADQLERKTQRQLQPEG